jgi:CheY-like chemotaxis protein
LAGGQALDTTAPSILVIEDNMSVRRLVSAVLQAAGYRVFTATDGTAGLWAIGEYRPDLVLLDIDLPGMDGFAVLAQAKADAATAHIPICAFTERDVDEELSSAGFDHFLAKSVDAEVLRTAVERMLGDH